MAQSPSTGGKKVLVCDVGTNCDWLLMATATRDLWTKGDVDHITYLTDKGNGMRLNPDGISRFPEMKIVTMKPPPAMSDLDMIAADSSFSMLELLKRHPRSVWENLRWVLESWQILSEELHTGGFDYAVFAYSAMHLIFGNPSAATLPVFILYWAPAVPNCLYAWPMDSRLRDPTLSGPSLREELNLESHASISAKLSLFGFPWNVAVVRRPRTSPCIYHVFAWSKTLLPPGELEDFTRFSGVPDGNASMAGPVVPLPQNGTTPEECRPFLTKLLEGRQEHARPLVYLTFGSFVPDKIRCPGFQNFMKGLLDYCQDADCILLVHGKVEQLILPDQIGASVYLCPRYVNYVDVAEKCSLVVFSGSLCLQNICLAGGTPMVFVPLLNEQYFWGQAYKNCTGVPFIDLRVSNVDPKEVQDVLVKALAAKDSDEFKRLHQEVESSAATAPTSIADYVRSKLPDTRCKPLPMPTRLREKPKLFVAHVKTKLREMMRMAAESSSAAAPTPPSR
jgi:hypothetical protein